MSPQIKYLLLYLVTLSRNVTTGNYKNPTMKVEVRAYWICWVLLYNNFFMIHLHKYEYQTQRQWMCSCGSIVKSS